MSVIVPIVAGKFYGSNVFDNFKLISLKKTFSEVFEICLSQHMQQERPVELLRFDFVKVNEVLISLSSFINHSTWLAVDASKVFVRVNYCIAYLLLFLHHT